MAIWQMYPDTLPEHHQRVFISDGKEVALAYFWIDPSGYKSFMGSGFGGYEWEWDFEPKYWAEAKINLP